MSCGPALRKTGRSRSECRATDVNLDPSHVESRVASGAPGHMATGGVARSQRRCKLRRFKHRAPCSTLIGSRLAGTRPLAIRATVSDRAGNSAVYLAPNRVRPGRVRAIVVATVHQQRRIDGGECGDASRRPIDQSARVRTTGSSVTRLELGARPRRPQPQGSPTAQPWPATAVAACTVSVVDEWHRFSKTTA